MLRVMDRIDDPDVTPDEWANLVKRTGKATVLNGELEDVTEERDLRGDVVRSRIDLLRREHSLFPLLSESEVDVLLAEAERTPVNLRATFDATNADASEQREWSPLADLDDEGMRSVDDVDPSVKERLVASIVDRFGDTVTILDLARFSGSDDLAHPSFLGICYDVAEAALLAHPMFEEYLEREPGSERNAVLVSPYVQRLLEKHALSVSLA